MREVLEGPGEGQIVRFGGRSKDVVHPWLVCKEEKKKKDMSRACIKTS